MDELIRIYAKQLKIPSFAEYREILRQAEPSSGFPDLLLELIKTETLSRQENQNRRRLKAAGFPYLKTLEEFDCTQLNDAVSQLPVCPEPAKCDYDWKSRPRQDPLGNCFGAESLHPGIPCSV